jgi:hypothetical protein
MRFVPHPSELTTASPHRAPFPRDRGKVVMSDPDSLPEGKPSPRTPPPDASSIEPDDTTPS